MSIRNLRLSVPLWVNNFSMGLMYFCISSLSTLIGTDLGFTDSQLSILFSLPTFMYVISGWLPGTIVDRLGIRRSLPITFLLIWIPGLLKIFTGSYTIFVVLTVLQSFGIMISSPTTSRGIKLLDSKDSAKILGIVNTGMSIGTWITHTFALKLANTLSRGWRGAIIVFLLVTAFLAIVGNCLFFTATPPFAETDRRQEKKASDRIALFSGDKNHVLILIGVAVLYFGTLSTNFSLNNWLPKLLTYGGFTAEVSARCASVYSLGSMCTSLGIPFLLPSVPNKVYLPIYATALTIAALTALSFSDSVLAVCLIALLLGMIIGALQLMVQYQIVANSSSQDVGKYSSFVFCIGNAGATLAIIGVGLIPESMYAGKLLFIATFSLMSAIGGIILYRTKKRI